LRAVYPAIRKGQGVASIPLHFLSDLKYLERPCAEAFVATCGVKTKFNTATSNADTLRHGLISFLKMSGCKNIDLHEIDTALMHRYVNWLNGSGNNAPSVAESTRAIWFTYAVRILEWIKRSKAWSASISSDLSFLRNPWPGSKKGRKSKEVIPDDLASRIREACRLEVEHTMLAFYNTRDCMDALKPTLADIADLKRGALSKLDIDSVLTYLDIASEGGLIPTQHSPQKKIASMLAIHKLAVNRDIASRFYPTTRSLVPFVLLNAFGLGLNADTIRDSLVENFRIDDILANVMNFECETEAPTVKPEFSVAAFKGRSKRLQRVTIPVDDTSDNPAYLFRFLVEWTARIRPLASPHVARRLFIFSGHNSRITTFLGPEGNSDPASWAYVLKQFRADHKLEYFTLDMIRPTVMDVAYEEFRGDVRAVQTQANHRSATTTVASYTGPNEHQRQNMRLGAVSELRTRWRETEGVIDPRDQVEGLDLNCATPGWDCLDPYDSPFTEKGKLCTGYGRCPACRLASINLQSPIACCHAFNLVDAIDRSQQSMAPQAWLLRMAPAKTKLLNLWLPAFPLDVIRQAKLLDLPPMPAPE